MFIALKPLAERKDSADQVIARLRPKLAKEPGANLFLQPGAGHPHRRAAEQRALPVHAAGRRPRRASRVGAQDPRRAVQPARARRRQHGHAGQGPADVGRDRPRRRVAPRRHRAHDRHDAERPLRPAAGVDHLRAAQPVPRGDGGGAGVLAIAGDARRTCTSARRAARRCRCPHSRPTARRTRRSASTTRDSSSPRRSPSTCRRTSRCRRRRRAIDHEMLRIGVPATHSRQRSRAARARSRRRSRASRG